MPDEIRLWRVTDSEQLHELPRARLDLESRLQDWLADDISVLDPELLVIGREVETGYGGYIDLLCIDEVGDLVVVELKRDKTPREITAQALDYGSWVVDLSNDQVRTIAQRHLLEHDFDDAFRERFGVEVPETLNGDHRLMIVGANIDDSSERIIRYLSDTHGVNINAATFQYFRESDGREFIARVFLIEPEQVRLHNQARSGSKRRPNLTWEDLLSEADEAGAGELYRHALSRLEACLQKRPTRSSVGFKAALDGHNVAVLNLIPRESDTTRGLRFQLYRDRFARRAGLRSDEVGGLLPRDHTDWAYATATNPDPEYQGFEGFLASKAEIDRLADALEAAAPG